jgi:hypothetical protein
MKLACPLYSNDFLVIATDDRSICARGVISIYDLATSEKPAYPNIASLWSPGSGPPIAWGAMSGLSQPDSANPNMPTILYSIEDSFYGKSRIFRINASSHPYIIESGTTIKDSNGVLESAYPGLFVNDDKTVNLDLEGVTRDSKGFGWVVSEGKGSGGDGTPNILVQINSSVIIQKVVSLPPEIAAKKLKWGLEGVAFMDDGSSLGCLVVCLQRPWEGEDHPLILAYSLTNNSWIGFVRYPLDDVESPAGGWIGLSDISVHGRHLYILERDNQGGPDARVKRIYRLDSNDFSWNGEVVEKTLVYDIFPLLKSDSQGLTPEKVEGLAIGPKGMWIMNDNDGVDDYNGATYLRFVPLIL